MTRKRRTTSNDNTEARQKRVRSFRNRERRQRRKTTTQAPDDLTWLKRISIRMAAMKVLNDKFSEVPAFWLSIPSLGKGRNSASSDFYPCRSHNDGERVYYGFMFREHRDAQCTLWPDARKELTPDID